MKWITILGGVVLFIAPFVTGYGNSPAALWTSLIIGTIISVLGYRKDYKWAAAAGLIAFFAPWLLGFSGISSAVWNCRTIGGVIAIADSYYGLYGVSNTSKRKHA
jgi:hypothetical protein